MSTCSPPSFDHLQEEKLEAKRKIIEKRKKKEAKAALAAKAAA